MPKKILYKGKDVEELKKMPVEEYLDLLPARIRRRMKRAGVDPKLEKKIRKYLEALEQGKKPKPIRTHLRDTPILPYMIGVKFMVYNGKEFLPVEITPQMIGHYLGEFAMTRKKVEHGAPGIGASRSSLAVTQRK